jgi:undecaprenyl-diphosphatase
MLGAGALFLFARLADEVLERDSLALDQGVLLALQSHANPELNRAALALSLLGAQGLAVLLALALGGLVWRRRFGAAASLLLVVVGAQLLNNLLKLLFQRPRPSAVITMLPGQTWSFPSGHAMVSLAFYGFLAYLGWRLLRGRRRLAWLTALTLAVLLIGLARIYLGVHYFTDVVAGYTAGFIWLDTVILGGHLLERRATVRSPRPEVKSPESKAPGPT